MSKALRRLPIEVRHLDFAWVAFVVEGILAAARHLGMPFGTLSAVKAWRRSGALVRSIVRQVFKCPCGRYVDDFFGASRKGVVWHGERCTSFATTLLGLPCDTGKDDESLSSILILGAEVAIEWACKATRTNFSIGRNIDPIFS